MRAMFLDGKERIVLSLAEINVVSPCPSVFPDMYWVNTYTFKFARFDGGAEPRIATVHESKCREGWERALWRAVFSAEIPRSEWGDWFPNVPQ